jgi:signal transduction histidine kinase
MRSGALVAATRDIGPLPSTAALAELGHPRPTLFLSASEDQPNRLYAAQAVTAPDGTRLAVIEVSRDGTEMQTFLRVLGLVVAGSGGLALAAAFIASLLLARQITRPLRGMEKATHEIASGDFDRRLVVTSRDEIGRLAASINQMAADLGRLEASRREFIAKISHDLRTPLTAIKGLVINLQDVAPDDMQSALATVDEQADRLIRLVNDLLVLSRLQRGQLRLRLSATDLCEVVRAAEAVMAGKAHRLGVALLLDLPVDHPPLEADPDRLQQVVVNLLDNAVKATPAGGSVRLDLSATESEIMLTVRDEGEGPTEEEASRAFEPYSSGTGGGAGLGLAIARDIVTAHGGRIWLGARSGGGAEAGFSLPLA